MDTAQTKRATAAKGQPAKGQDSDIADINGGVNTDITSSEDQKRQDGTDASQDSGPHDPSPAATAGQDPGGTVLATYDGRGGTHANLAEPVKPLLVGETATGRNRPEKGSENWGHKFHPSIPNPTMQSPVLRGPDGDPNVTSYAAMRREAEAGEQAPVEVAPVE